mmetsp:Transcript_29005/g.63451  ORF Transcript_29005/g.63451 Transcript_29005/m.63451 type:complete len:423 (+) Transcript_29005:963-2231(+)
MAAEVLRLRPRCHLHRGKRGHRHRLMPGADRAVVSGSPGVQVNGQGSLHRLHLVGGDVRAHKTFGALVGGEQQRRVHPLHAVVGHSPTPVVLHRAPAGSGPDVVELPVEHPHGAHARGGFEAAPEGDGRLVAPRLLHLREEQVRVEQRPLGGVRRDLQRRRLLRGARGRVARGVPRPLRGGAGGGGVGGGDVVVPEHHLQNLLVAVRVAHTVLKEGAFPGPVLRGGQVLQEGKGGPAHEAVLAHEPRQRVPVVVLAVVPVVVEVHVPVLPQVRVLPPLHVGLLRQHPVGGRGVHPGAAAADHRIGLLDGGVDGLDVELEVVRLVEVLVLPRGLVPGQRGLVLVVAPEDDQARVVLQPAHLIFDLRPDGGEEGVVCGVQGTREHHFLPYHQPFGVGQVVELVRLVEPAAPDAHHVHVRVHRAL